MVKPQLAVAVAATALTFALTAAPAWSASPSPLLIATPPQPKWTELSVQQRIVLAPLSDEWDSMEYYRQKKWLGIALRFHAMSPAEQRRIQEQMQEWDRLTPEERQLVREKFKSATQLSADQKLELLQKWEEYQSLPESEKQKLKAEAAPLEPKLLSKPLPRTTPPAPAVTAKPTPLPSLTAPSVAPPPTEPAAPAPVLTPTPTGGGV